jgi:anti-sigma regulatory factor (Ser/Thr protein kinase)
MPQIKKMDVVPFLLDIVHQIEQDQQRGGEIFMILSELFNNALDHGLLKLDSALKHHEEGMEKYYEERANRLARTETGLIQLKLEKVLNEDASATLRIHVNDSGDGFDHHHVITRMANSDQRHGRGIPLLYRVCSSVNYLGNGAEVAVEFEL